MGVGVSVGVGVCVCGGVCVCVCVRVCVCGCVLCVSADVQISADAFPRGRAQSQLGPYLVDVLQTQRTQLTQDMCPPCRPFEFKMRRPSFVDGC